MNPDELRAPETDDEPWPHPSLGVFPDGEGFAGFRYLVLTVAVLVLAGLTLAAIAWRLLR